MIETIVERVARVLWELRPRALAALHWDDAGEGWRSEYRLKAERAIAEYEVALAGAGMVIRPRAPTEKMISDVVDNFDFGPDRDARNWAVGVWETMVDAYERGGS
jgi:hypothetical protein